MLDLILFVLENYLEFVEILTIYYTGFYIHNLDWIPDNFFTLYIIEA